MTIEFQFDPETHVYTSAAGPVLATSDILALNGLCNYDQLPLANLEYARWRGSQLHAAIDLYEQDDLDPESIPEDVLPYFEGYLRFKQEMGFKVIPPTEKALVYCHQETGQYIGCHIDLRGWIGDQVYIVDPKTSYPNSGAAKKQTHLRWRMQLESYRQATCADDNFWDETGSSTSFIGRSVLHLKKDGNFMDSRDFHEFIDISDMERWDAMVQIAQLKMANGFKLDRK